VFSTSRSAVILHDQNRPGNVLLIGQQVASSQYYVIALQANEYLLWGFNNGAGELTAAGSDLLANLVSYLNAL
jgi:hypothetical protein